MCKVASINYTSKDSECMRYFCVLFCVHQYFLGEKTIAFQNEKEELIPIQEDLWLPVHPTLPESYRESTWLEKNNMKARRGYDLSDVILLDFF